MKEPGGQMSKRPKTKKRLYCSSSECKCKRLHSLYARQDAQGVFARLWVCDTCFRGTRAGGFCCLACGGVKFVCLSTNGRYSRPDVITRVRRCRNKKCGAKYTTSERIEAAIK